MVSEMTNIGLRFPHVFTKDKIDKIIIKGVDDEEVVISKDGDQWLTSGSFPADQDKVERILDRLNKLEHGLSLATTDAAIKRFRVSENDFERYLQLEINGNTVAEMYLGTGAGARRIHVRPANEAAVYVVEFSSYELSSEISEWQDKTVLHIVADDVTSIEANDIANQVYYEALGEEVSEVVERVMAIIKKALELGYDGALNFSGSSVYGWEAHNYETDCGICIWSDEKVAYAYNPSLLEGELWAIEGTVNGLHLGACWVPNV